MSMSSPYKKNASRMTALASSGSEIDGNASVPAGRINPRTGNVISSNTESLFGQNGHLNAGSKAEAAEAGAVFHKRLEKGQVRRAFQRDMTTAQRQVQADRVRMAFDAPAGDIRGLQAIAQVMGNEIHTALGRESFARNVLMLQNLNQGEDGRITVERKDVVAYQVMEAGVAVPAEIRQFFAYPAHFSIAGQVLMTNKEIAASPNDMLERAYNKLVEQILRQEDLSLIAMARRAAAAVNDLVLFGTMTPAILSRAQLQITGWTLPVASMIMSYDLWNDIRTDPEWANYFDPVTKKEILMEGSVSELFGIQIVTDGFRDKNLRVLDAGEAFLFTAPEALGVMQIRTDLKTTAVDRYPLGEDKRGFFASETIGMLLPHSRGVVRMLRGA